MVSYSNNNIAHTRSYWDPRILLEAVPKYYLLASTCHIVALDVVFKNAVE